MMKEYIIDAENKKLGRVASQAAIFLRGKKESDFELNKMPQVKVKIINAGKIKIDDKKAKNKIYRRHSFYPGGEKRETLEKLLQRKGINFIIKKAVLGMLPQNKLKKGIIKNLIISE